MHDDVQAMLSPFLDGELTQAARQRVRIHLEDCEECRNEFAELQKLKNLTGELRFAPVPEDKMEALGQRLSVKAPQRLGWSLFAGGAVAWLLYAAYQFATSPIPPWEKLTISAVLIGLVLLLVSVARQRWLELPHDRYRGVKK